MRRIQRILARPIDLPLREPFETAQRRATSFPTVIIELHAGEIVGLGEATPVRYVTGEDVKSVIADVAAANEALEGARLTDTGCPLVSWQKPFPTGGQRALGSRWPFSTLFARTSAFPCMHFWVARR